MIDASKLEQMKKDAEVAREQAVQSNLARLLATENIHVQFRKANTASFDLKTRVLTIPIFSKELSVETATMLTTHECGHAIETPREKWTAYIEAHPKQKHHVNGLEDIRIDRKMKLRYPGVAKDYWAGNQWLFKNGFYGQPKEVVRDLSTMSLADRINLFHNYGGSLGNFNFTEEEKKFVEEAGKTESFDDVLDLAARVYAYDKARAKEAQQRERDKLKDSGLRPSDRLPLPPQEDQPAEDFNENEDRLPEDRPTPEQPVADDDDDDDDTPAEPSGADYSDDEDAASDDGDDDADDDDADDGEGGSDQGKKFLEGLDDDEDFEPEPEVITTQTRYAREQELVDESARDIVNAQFLNIPAVENFIIPFKPLLDKAITSSFTNYGGEVDEEQRQRAGHNITTALKDFRKKHAKYVAHMAREFTMRQNASQFVRSHEAKTGSLNLTKMHEYKFNDDLFKKVMVVPKGKNHGMLVFVDVSGSMLGILNNVLEQAAVLALFCRHVSIPCRVYAWSTGRGGRKFNDLIDNAEATEEEKEAMRAEYEAFVAANQVAKDDPRNLLTLETNFYLAEIFSEKMNSREFAQAIYAYTASSYGRNVLQCGGTPLSSVIMQIPNLVTKLRKETGAEKMSAIILTDGDGDTPRMHLPVGEGQPPQRGEFRVQSPWSRRDYNPGFKIQSGGWSLWGHEYDMTKTLIEMVRDATGIPIIGYHIVRKSAEFITKYLKFSSRSSHDMQMDFRNRKFFMVDKFGYARYFVMNERVFEQEVSEELNVKIDNNASNRRIVGTLERAFTQQQRAKSVNRLFLTEFVKLIA